MNRPPEESKRISETQLRDFAGACFKAAGLREDHAEQLAQLLTNGDLRGVHSHGLRQVPGYCESLRDGLINPNPNCQVLKETPTAVLIDGDGGLGYAPMMMATESAIDQSESERCSCRRNLSYRSLRFGGALCPSGDGSGLYRLFRSRRFKRIWSGRPQQPSSICLLGQSPTLLRACPVGTNRRLSLTWQPASSPTTSVVRNLMPCRK